MDNNTSKQSHIVETAMTDTDQNGADRNNDRFSTRTSTVSDVVPQRQGRPRGRPRKSTEKYEEPVENNGISTDSTIIFYHKLLSFVCYLRSFDINLLRFCIRKYTAGQGEKKRSAFEVSYVDQQLCC